MEAFQAAFLLCREVQNSIFTYDTVAIDLACTFRLPVNFNMTLVCGNLLCWSAGEESEALFLNNPLVLWIPDADKNEKPMSWLRFVPQRQASYVKSCTGSRADRYQLTPTNWIISRRAVLSVPAFSSDTCCQSRHSVRFGRIPALHFSNTQSAMSGVFPDLYSGVLAKQKCICQDIVLSTPLGCFMCST